MKRALRCVVCDHASSSSSGMCRGCRRAYDRYSKWGGGSVWDVIAWAARRSRRYARKRGPRASEP